MTRSLRRLVLGLFSRASARARRRDSGPRGEALAAKWLRRRGYRILARNLRVGDDEIDILAIDPDRQTIVVTEVKTRRDDDRLAEDAIDRRKQFRLARAAARLQKQAKYRDRPIRIDAIAITWPEGGEPDVRHYIGAFDAPF